MGQRTQILVNLTNKQGKTESFAIHNQWGFWRPTVTGVYSILDYVIECMDKTEKSYSVSTNQNELHIMACRPFGWDEFFSWTMPYWCSNHYKDDEHDNNDGYAIINIDEKNLRFDYEIYWSVEYIDDKNYFNRMDDVSYLKHTGAEQYIWQEWISWAIEKKTKINKFLWKEEDVEKDFSRLNIKKQKRIVKDREEGNTIQEVEDEDEGIQLIQEFEKMDKLDWIYKENFYELVKK